MKIGVIGSGIVGQVLANGLIKYGYDVMIGTNHSRKACRAQAEDPRGGEDRHLRRDGSVR